MTFDRAEVERSVAEKRKVVDMQRRMSNEYYEAARRLSGDAARISRGLGLIQALDAEHNERMVELLRQLAEGAELVEASRSELCARCGNDHQRGPCS